MPITTGQYEEVEKQYSTKKVVALLPVEDAELMLTPFVRMPLMFHALQATIHSNVNEVWVITDNIKLETFVQSCGAKVIKSKEVFEDTVDYDILIIVEPAVPMVKSCHINEGLQQLLKHEEYDSVISMCELEGTFWTHSKLENNTILKETNAFRILRKGSNNMDKVGIYETPYWLSFQIRNVSDMINIERLMR